MSQKLLGTLIIVALVVGSLALAFGPELLRARKRDALLREGQPASATIVRLVETGNVYNDQPEVRVILLVQPPDGQAYQAEVVEVQSAVALQAFQIGNEVAVKYDPAAPHEVALAGQPQPPRAGPTPGSASR